MEKERFNRRERSHFPRTSEKTTTSKRVKIISVINGTPETGKNSLLHQESQKMRRPR